MKSKTLDSLLPPEMAVQAEHVGVAKANMPVTKTLVLSILAGAFITFGAIFFTTVTAGSTMSFGMTRLIGGICFSLGLVLVILGGAELFTGNSLIIMAWANKKISAFQVLRNWFWVFIGNFIGALFIVVLMFFAEQHNFGNGIVGQHILNIAKVKCEMGFSQAIALGILCNILVCLAVWLCFSTKSAAGKIVCIIFPIAAFVTIGFEHSVANMYFIPMALVLLSFGDAEFLSRINQSGQNYDAINWDNFLFGNMLPVTIGNIMGGAVLVGLVYWFIFLKHQEKNKA
jgi:formate transporter